MVGWSLSNLRPFESHVGDEVRIGGFSSGIIARTDRIDGFSPMLRCECFGVVGQGKKVEGRTITSEIAGIGRGMRAFSANDGQTAHERVGGKRRMHVEIAKKNLLG